MCIVSKRRHGCTAALIEMIAVAWIVTSGTRAQSATLPSDGDPQTRQTIEKLEGDEIQAVLRNDVAALEKLWSDDYTVNAPHNQIVRKAQILDFVKKQTGLQYSTVERHREAMVFRPGIVVVLGYEVVVPKAGTDNSGKTVTRRYTNVWHSEAGTWRLIARQATNISAQ